MNRSWALRHAFRGRRRLLGAATIAAALALGAGTASAQREAADYFNHLTCFKAKADQKVKGSTELETMFAGVAEFAYDESCTVKKVSHVCVMSHTASTQAQIQKDAVDVQQGAPGTSQFARICYRIKCKEKPEGELQLQDQFAGYDLTKLKPDLLCGPAVSVCADPTRTVYGGGPNTGFDDGACRQFTSQQTCEVAWVAQQAADYGALVPQQCAWDGSTCIGALHAGVENSCIACANPSLSQADSCSGLADQGACEVNYTMGVHGPTSCVWDPGFSQCVECGATAELGLRDYLGPPCANSCRGG